MKHQLLHIFLQVFLNPPYYRLQKEESGQFLQQQKCCFFSEQNKVFVVTAGPMASVLAYDLTKMGERCIDIGKIAFEYAKWRGYHKLETFISQDTWQEKKRVWKYDENLKRVEVML